MRLILLFLFLACAAVPAWSQGRNLSIREGTAVVIKFAPDFLTFQRVSGNTGRTSYVGKVSRNPGGAIAVNGTAEWRDTGWAYMAQLSLAKVDKQRDFVEVELRDAGSNYKIQFDNSVGDLDAAFREVVFVGDMGSFTSSEYYRKEIADRLLPKVFSGPLAAIPRERQLQMIKDLGYSTRSIAGETYLKKFYIVIAYAPPFYDYDVFNRVSARSARMKDTVHDTLNSFLRQGYPGIQGIKWYMKLRYGHQYETTGYQETGSEYITAYIPFNLVREYEADSITEQQLVNKLRILVDDSPVKITVPATFGFPYFLGPKGGCYKINSNGNKQYVDAGFCG
jgi:hypothetical protein